VNWDHPDHEVFKERRDESQILTSWYVARPLVQKQLDGHPLTEAERMYVRRFYGSNVNQEFFCRLGLTFANNSECWLPGIPTEEQCQRCSLHYASTHVVNFGRDEVPNAPPDRTNVSMVATKDEQGITRITWIPVKDAPAGMNGQFIAGVQHAFSSSLTRIFPVCLPGLSPSFDKSCDGNCAKCPGYGYYDATQETTTTNLGNVKLTNATLHPRIAERLKVIGTQHEEPPLDERIEVRSNDTDGLSPSGDPSRTELPPPEGS
jgi:hypothetical protein